MKSFLQSEKFQQLLIRWALVLVPTILIGYITLRFLNFSYTNLSTGIGSQTLYFALGLVLAYSLYYYGARWIVSVILLYIVYWLFEKMISRLPGEFDVFYATARFQLYSTLFLFGWGFGFLLQRVKWSYFIIFGVLVIATLASVSDTIDISLSYILLHLAPVVVYGLYMLFLSPLLTEKIEIDFKKSRSLVVRMVLFALLVVLAFVVTATLLRGNLKAVEKELAARGGKNDKDGKNNGDSNNKDGGGNGYDERNGLMEKHDDGYRLKDTMRVNSKMSQSDKLMFCAKLENYFPDGSPAPIYFVYHYLTRYDPVKESFTRDVDVPSLDEMQVDPTALPLYYSAVDTSIFRKSMATKARKIVEAQVYLSENTWKHSVLGPASVFALQTIPVEKAFQKQFLHAYKINSFTSELNNAYFVYNISASPQLEDIQEQRNEELGKIKNYRGIDRKFMDYYTLYPSGPIYDSISKLAHSLVPADAKPIDKVMAVRDFFLKRNENGKRIFRYTLKAGAVDDPNIPSSRMLYNFLFKTHAGYCTYYAGASLFMLRSLGVPVRFTTGFATVNRSDKNKGWYWFYASQAHAWTQVYFPEYGWMDFDMTIGNEDQQSAPKPDGTPPLPPPDPWLVLNAKAESVDLTAKRLDASFKNLLFLNAPYQAEQPITRTIDASLCRVLYNEKDTTLSALHAGDSILIVSYKDEAKRIPTPQPGVSIKKQMASFPSPIIADEIHIRGKEKEKPKDDGAAKKNKANEKQITWQQIAWAAAIFLGSVIALIVLFPILFFLYLLVRIAFAKDGNKKADAIYQAILYRLHMAGYEREGETPLEFAKSKIDAALGIHFEDFMHRYLRLKYLSNEQQPDDKEAFNQFASSVGPAIRKKHGIIGTVANYFRLLRAYRYFQQPGANDYEVPTL